ncbi:MAG: sarcosine oxidase subunit alpha, partial [Albidovulum sp.]
MREGVGIYDGAPLGKYEIKGPDAGAFLDWIYTNVMSSLPVGDGHYGLMLSDDGLILDDGVSFRLAGDRFFMSTSTGNADAVGQHMEKLLQIERPDWRVMITNVTGQWANATICGPKARDVVAHDLGMSWVMSKKKPDYLGKRSVELRRSTGGPRRELVGIRPLDPNRQVPEGAPLTPGGRKEATEGFVTACVWSV